MVVVVPDILDGRRGRTSVRMVGHYYFAVERYANQIGLSCTNARLLMHAPDMH